MYKVITFAVVLNIGSHSYEKVKIVKCLGSLFTNKNSSQEEIKCRLKAENSYVLFCTIICIIFTSLCKNLVKLT